jgi:hypothetical protein
MAKEIIKKASKVKSIASAGASFVCWLWQANLCLFFFKLFCFILFHGQSYED